MSKENTKLKMQARTILKFLDLKLGGPCFIVKSLSLLKSFHHNSNNEGIAGWTQYELVLNTP